MGIFAIATAAALGIFVTSNQVQKRTANLQRELADARYALEVMAREVRMGAIDYGYDGYASPLPFLESVLAIRDADDQPIRFGRFDVGSGRYAIKVCDQEICNVEDWLDITPEDLSIARLDFYISPAEDPFTWNGATVNYPFDSQPLVTIVMQSVGTYLEGEINRVVNLQTTVASRQYVR